MILSKFVNKTFCIVFLLMSQAVLSEEKCFNKPPPTAHMILHKQMNFILFKTMCEPVDKNKIPASLQNDFDNLMKAREEFYQAMLDIGNEADDGETSVDIKKNILTLAKTKAVAEIRLFAKLNGLENVLTEKSPIRMRIMKFPSLPRKAQNLTNPDSSFVANNPFPGDPEWANFSLQNEFQNLAIVELYLEDANGVLHKFKSYRSQGIAGSPGPKLKEGDFQVPEGEFSLDQPSMVTQRLFSIGVNANPKNIPGRGSNIKIHGSGPSEGCIVLSNAAVAEVSGYMVAGKKPKDSASVLITPFKMESDNYKKYYDQMNDSTKAAWAREIKNHPYLNEFDSLDDYWDYLSSKSSQFRTCNQSKQSNCVSKDDYELPDESSCLKHGAFANRPYISAQYLALASKSKTNYKEEKKPDRPKITSNSNSASAPEKPKVQTLTCPEGKSLRYRIEYLIMGNGASIGSSVITAKSDEEANLKAKKEYPNATRLTVTPFCMIISSSGY